MEMYMQGTAITIELAADISGTSVRSLQRRLAKKNYSYSKLVNHYRFKNSIPLLKDSSYKIIDIAYDLGYSDPAHFSRAFKRWSGVSPREYRRQFSV